MIATNRRGVHARLLVEAQRLDPRRQDEAVEARTGFARRANHYVIDQQRADVGAFGVDPECPHHRFGGSYRTHFYDHAIQNAAVATEGDEIELHALDTDLGLVLNHEIEAATIVCVLNAVELDAWAMQIARRRGIKKAIVALARRLAVIMHRIWVDGTEFRWTREQATAAAA